MHLAPEKKVAGGAGAAPAAPPVASEEQDEPPAPVTIPFPEPEESAEVRRRETRIPHCSLNSPGGLFLLFASEVQV